MAYHPAHGLLVLNNEVISECHGVSNSSVGILIPEGTAIKYCTIWHNPMYQQEIDKHTRGNVFDRIVKWFNKIKNK